MKFHNPLDTYIGCGGTILDSKTILTAAHCMTDDMGNPPQPEMISIEAGVTNKWTLGEHGQEALIESYTAHPNYNPCEFV